MVTRKKMLRTEDENEDRKDIIHFWKRSPKKEKEAEIRNIIEGSFWHKKTWFHSLDEPQRVIEH